MKICTQPKHKWVWKKDQTHQSMGKRPGYIRLSRKGVYQCDHCAELKYGAARSGL